MRQVIEELLEAELATLAWLEKHYQGRESYQTGRGIRFALRPRFITLWRAA